jgi:4-methyl-5(b-hydroxyethyl)-thiazole monophosphate biosynthesis
MPNKSALVFFAQGCEDLEAVTCVDLLRRANINVVTVGLDNLPVVGSRKTTFIPDATLDEVLANNFDLLVLPGGLPGADNLGNDERVVNLVKKMASEGKLTCAICAAPSVLAIAGVLSGKRATCYPGRLESMGLSDVTITGEAVTRDGNVITSRGPGTAIDFALAMIDALLGSETRDRVNKSLVR